jgi:hypothetical protein
MSHKAFWSAISQSSNTQQLSYYSSHPALNIKHDTNYLYIQIIKYKFTQNFSQKHEFTRLLRGPTQRRQSNIKIVRSEILRVDHMTLD